MTDQTPQDNEAQELLAALMAGNAALEAELAALTTEREAVFNDMEREFAAAEKTMTDVTAWMEQNGGGPLEE